MRYRDLIKFDPITTVIQVTDITDESKAANLVKTYVMSDSMAENLRENMLRQLKLEETVDNKGVMLIGNYGTGKSHLMSVITAIAVDSENLQYCRNRKFAEDAECIAGKFEALSFDIGSVEMSLRNIFFTKVQADLQNRGIAFDFPAADQVAENKTTLLKMMDKFHEKYPDKGYLVVIDELLDYLKTRNDQEVIKDLNFLREVGEVVGKSRLRFVVGMQEKIYGNPRFAHISQTLNWVKDRYWQISIRKEDVQYVVSERILQKTEESKAWIRSHLQQFCSCYPELHGHMEEYVSLFPIHPAYFEAFSKIYIIEQRHILQTISNILEKILDENVAEDEPSLISYDSFWNVILNQPAWQTDPSVKEVVSASNKLHDIISHSFPKAIYKPMALKIIDGLSVHRLTTGDITVKAGLTEENMRDDFCLYLKDMPDQDADTLRGIIRVIMQDIFKTVSGQFIQHNDENGQYYLDVHAAVNYDELISQRAETLDNNTLNRAYWDLMYTCLDWNTPEYVTNFKIYQHTLNWHTHNIFRHGYIFMGTPENRPTAYPPEDYYIYFLPLYGSKTFIDEKKSDEVFFRYKPSEEFTAQLRMYAAAEILKIQSSGNDKLVYQRKSDEISRKLHRILNDAKATGYDVTYCGKTNIPMQIMQNAYRSENPLKETIELTAAICLNSYFENKYPEFPVFKEKITADNYKSIFTAVKDRFAGKDTKQANIFLESLGLMEAGKISAKNSRYAKYYDQMLSKRPKGSVINFDEIFEPRVEGANQIFEDYEEKHWHLPYVIAVPVFLAMVSSGQAVMDMKSGTITASNLETLTKKALADFEEIKYISHPKDIPLPELVKLYEVLDLPIGLITNPDEREKGLIQMLAKTDAMALVAATRVHELRQDTNLWDEALYPTTTRDAYRASAQKIVDTFNNFKARFNKVAKLNNFDMTIEQCEALEKDIQRMKVVEAYQKFANKCKDQVNYMMSISAYQLPDDLRNDITAAREQFRSIRDQIADTVDGDSAAAQVNSLLQGLKDRYIDWYMAEHNKHRLDVKESKRKNQLMNSGARGKLTRLKSIDFLPANKLDVLETKLAGLKTCYDLTPDKLKSATYCTSCRFMPDSNEPLVKGQLDVIEEQMEEMLADWTKSLHDTVSDPTLSDQMQYLTSEQQKRLKAFIETAELPEPVDTYFVDAVKKYIDGFDVVTIDSDQLLDTLIKRGPCNEEEFRKVLDEMVNKAIRGKDKSKLRIVVK